MANLFEIKADIIAAIKDVVDEETGEIIGTEMDFKRLEELELQQEEKRKYIAQLYKNASSDAEQYKALKMEYSKKQKRAEGLAESLKEYLSCDLDGEKWEADDKTVKVNYRTVNNKVFISDINKIPHEYFSQKYDESTLSKTRVKEAILDGKNVEGAQLITAISMSIK